ncbi:PQQ-dependent sugar dehydrogenase [Mucilaginibacter sp. cycad4]|uniref:PQQ-dependent sugar dehydrogenase n=1 Tax=Mucilaginibacter sp. cycad4 TaxID=3342096 RepID=UPI002AAB37A3|nr:PQQ-dependent sugar dehydrogenase [Mucilaginibacter gossypii]WPV02942.1 PQQ-dependent sugar dehydrogenase [Mucilaginibacter gossypii]
MKKLFVNNKKRPAFWGIMGMSAVMIICSSYVFPGSKPNIAEPPLITVKVQQVSSNLQSPTALTFPGNGDIWVTEQPGKIRVVKNGKLLDEPLLDLRSKMLKVNKGYEERGLLGICLHPQFKSNKKFYVFYSANTTGKFNHKDVIAEYKLSANSNGIDPNSGRIILEQDKPDGNHDGGCIQFGRDGYLYISFGDGGGQGDKHGEIGNGQNLGNLLGKILRVDVNTNATYNVPKTNPFVGKKDARPEIWASGFRNPYRFSFDKASGQLFAGDVGQDLWEEVDIVTKGANYGWRLTEGTHCYNPATGCDIKGITMPIAEYSHTEGVSVIGGYVYNGKQVPVLKSKYVFADWVGKMFYLQKSGSQWQRGKITFQNIPANLKIIGFGEDPAGEVYVLTNSDTGPENANGSIYKIVKN